MRFSTVRNSRLLIISQEITINLPLLSSNQLEIKIKNLHYHPDHISNKDSNISNIKIMAHNKEQNRKVNDNSSNITLKKCTPMIMERVNRYPVVNMAISAGFSQYGKLKSSNVTVGDVMSRAEGWAVYLWQKVQPIVEKLKDPIDRADQLACRTLDFVEDKLHLSK